jgi:hypothetical protein
MAVTDDALIQSLVQQLDAAVPREGHVEVLGSAYDDESQRLRANRLGYLRLGVELLKAAYAQPPNAERPERVEVDVEYLTGLENCMFHFERCEDEDVWRPVYSEPPGALSQIAKGAVILVLVGTFLTGALTIFRWLGKLVF